MIDLSLFIRNFRPQFPEVISSVDRLNTLRKQVPHHLVVGLTYAKSDEDVEEITRVLTLIQQRNPNIKVILVNEFKILPDSVIYGAASPVIVLRQPIFEEFIGMHEDVVVFYKDGSRIDDIETEKQMKKTLRNSRIDFIDNMNINLYDNFERSIVSIVTTHPSADDISRNQAFYKALAKFLYDGGLLKHPEYDYAIINANQITSLEHDFQLSMNYPGRNFFLAILKDQDTGYIYEDVIIRENESMEKVMTADTIDKYLKDYRENKLNVYLRSEKRETELTYEGRIL